MCKVHLHMEMILYTYVDRIHLDNPEKFTSLLIFCCLWLLILVQRLPLPVLFRVRISSFNTSLFASGQLLQLVFLGGGRFQISHSKIVVELSRAVLGSV